MDRVEASHTQIELPPQANRDIAFTNDTQWAHRMTEAFETLNKWKYGLNHEGLDKLKDRDISSSSFSSWISYFVSKANPLRLLYAHQTVMTAIYTVCRLVVPSKPQLPFQFVALVEQLVFPLFECKYINGTPSHIPPYAIYCTFTGVISTLTVISLYGNDRKDIENEINYDTFNVFDVLFIIYSLINFGFGIFSPRGHYKHEQLRHKLHQLSTAPDKIPGVSSHINLLEDAAGNKITIPVFKMVDGKREYEHLPRLLDRGQTVRNLEDLAKEKYYFDLEEFEKAIDIVNSCISGNNRELAIQV